MNAMSDTKQPGASRAAIPRRGFLKRAGVAVAGAAAFPTIIPSSALGADGAVAPSNRIVMGCIGTGSQGTSNMKGFLRFPELQIVAVCDVDRARREEAKKIVDAENGNTDCAEYNDFREVLARTDLDAVSLALPDHWHAIPAIAAAKAGLDIYAEKPLALTIGEGRAMVDAVHRYGTVWQTGSWQRSQSHFRRACELVRSGKIGEVHTVHVGLPTGSSIDVQPVMPIPDGFDYDFWLGPAPYEPYTKERCHWNFRWILDYSGGQLTDWAAHHCDIANWGMGTEYTGPAEIEGRGNYPRDGLWNAATTYKFEARYPAGASPVAPNGFTMVVANASEESGFQMGAKFFGSEGTIYVSRGNTFETDPPSLKDAELGPNDVHLYESDNHARNFIECVYERKQTITPIDVAYNAINIAHLGNIAMQLERKVTWDPVNERFLDDPIADRMRSRAMRAPWHL